MPLLVRHNFNSNWRHADGAGDNSMKMEMVSTEIAKLINKNPQDIIKYLNLLGYKVKENISAADLIQKMVLAIQEEPRFAAVLAHLIRGKKVPEKFFGPDGNTQQSGGNTTDWGAIFASAAQIIGTIGELTAAQKAAKARKEAAAKAAKAKAEREAREARDKAAKDLKDKANGLGGDVGMTTRMKLIIGGSIAGTLIIGTVVAVVWYKKTH